MSDIGYESQGIEQALAREGKIMVCTSGVSMHPMLRHRQDMIVLEKVSRPLRKHDVPLYRLSSGKLVLHRILKVDGGAYIIRGDNLFHKEYVTEDMIIGVLKSFYRGKKYYECATSKKYRVYIAYIRVFYLPRKLWSRGIRPVLSKIKHFILQ